MQHGLLAAEVASGGRPDADSSRRQSRLATWRNRRARAKLLALPFLPKDEVVFGPLFFKTLYYHAKRHGYTKNEKNALHITIFRRFMRRLHCLIGDYHDHPTDMDGHEAIDQLPTWIGWADLRRALDDPHDPDTYRGPSLEVRVTRNLAEKVQAVLEGNCSIVGRMWTTFMACCILVSLALIVFGKHRFPENTNGFCIVVFTVEYLLSLGCSPFCRRTLLNSERIYDLVVPASEEDPNATLEIKAAMMSRLMAHFWAPLNVVDLISIIPWWISHLGSASSFKLGFLRTVRILRLVRLVKAGSFVRDFQIMGDVLSRSFGSIAAIAITLCVLALMFGAVMAQLENKLIEQDLEGAIWTDNVLWVDMLSQGNAVPDAMLWVSGRLTGVQSSMAAKEAVPANWYNQMIVLILGIMKGFVFLLPLGQIKQFFKDEAEHFMDLDELEYEVEMEKFHKVGDEWSGDIKTPYALIEVWRSDETMEDRKRASAHPHGWLNLPINQKTRADCVVHCHILDLVKVMCKVDASSETSPGIVFEVRWEPQAGAEEPRGTLSICPLRGVNFPVSAQPDGWKLRIRVPEKLYGTVEDQGTPQYSSMSTGSAEEPTWDSTFTYNINWSAKEKFPEDTPEFRRQESMQVEEEMKNQDEKMKSIEDAAAAKLEKLKAKKGKKFW